MTSRTTREARRDAHVYARAAMAHGDGAGVQRRLIAATVESKARHNPAYGAAFTTALGREDMAEHAHKARTDRRRRDVNTAISRNVKGLATGRIESVNTSVIVLIGAGVILHKTGMDEVIIEKSRRGIKNIKNRMRARKGAPQNVTSMRG